jgi:stage V sporulation protein G
MQFWKEMQVFERLSPRIGGNFKNPSHIPAHSHNTNTRIRHVTTGGGFLLNITDIRVRRTFQDNKLKALVSVTIDNDFAVHDIKVIDGTERLFVAMPSRKDENGVFRDIAHPITPEARRTLEQGILSAYYEYLEAASQPSRREEQPTAEDSAPADE